MESISYLFTILKCENSNFEGFLNLWALRPMGSRLGKYGLMPIFSFLRKKAILDYQQTYYYRTPKKRPLGRFLVSLRTKTVAFDVIS